MVVTREKGQHVTISAASELGPCLPLAHWAGELYGSCREHSGADAVQYFTGAGETKPPVICIVVFI